MFTFRVHAGPYARRLCPVVATLPDALGDPVTLLQQPGDRPRSCQPCGNQLWWLVRDLPAGATLEFRLHAKPRRRPPRRRLRWEALQTDQFQLRMDDEPVMGYQAGTAHVLPGLHGILTPGGQVGVATVATTASLRDVVHCRTWLKERPVIQEGPVWTSLRQQGYWVDADDRRIAEETTSFVAYALPPGRRLLDVFVSLRASFGPVGFDAAAPGGLLQLTLPSAIQPGWVDAHGRKDWSSTAAPWCVRHGPESLAIISHPANPGGMPTWHQASDGALCVNPFGNWSRYAPLHHDAPLTLTLPAGRVATWRYRFLMLGENTKWHTPRQSYLDLADPPRVEIVDGRGASLRPSS